MKIHYATTTIVTIACGKDALHEKICFYCKSIIKFHFLETTFNKKKVTCKNCLRTKIYAKTTGPH